MTVIKADKLCKLYKNGRGISDISFEVEEGDIVGLLGPNGSGKTTTMKIIVGLCKPQSGSLFIFGKQADENIHRLLKDIGVLIEAPAVFTDMTAEQNMKMAARYYDGVDAGRIDAVLDAVHLLSYKKEKAGRASVGV